MRKILPKNEMQCRDTEERERPQGDYSMMRSFKRRALAVTLALALPTWAQYPGHIESAKKAAPTIRAIAVLEWTGEMGKPKASRIIPISVFDGEQYQPGGLYLAKPEPLALQPGTEYVLQDAGITKGIFDINSAQDVDGYWFGYGAWKPMTSPPKRVKPKQGRLTPQVVGGDDGHPHLVRKDGSGAQDSSTSGGSSSSSSSTKASNNPPSDPDRPTLRKRSDSSDSTPSTSSASSGNSPAPETAIGGADPDRPHMAHGQQSMSDDIQPAQLTGVPSGLEQMIAVSDASDREAHPFVYLWADPADATNMQTQMEIAASNAVAAAQPPVKPAVKAHTTTTAHPATTAAQRRKTAAAPPAPPKLVFTNERFKAYELTFSGGATLVFSGETTDHAGKTKYVTLIAQPDFNGVPKVLFKSVTDDDHLDQTPKMRLVDAVDARADNRGDLVFELRSSHDREFVIYRVSAGQAEQVFTTGSLPNSSSQS
jgi:hypothetical protein